MPVKRAFFLNSPISNRGNRIFEQNAVGGLRKTRHRGEQRVGWMFEFSLAAYNLVRLRNLMANAAWRRGSSVSEPSKRPRMTTQTWQLNAVLRHETAFQNDSEGLGSKFRRKC